MDWQPLLAYIAGSVDEEPMLRDEYLVTDNRQQPDDPICCRERLGGLLTDDYCEAARMMFA
jgi:hypothetical protein